MPLARLTTPTQDQAAEAADYLRARGYHVELLAPGTAPAAPADLDIDLGPRQGREALEHVQRAEQNRRVATAYDITGRPVEFAEEDEPAASGNALRQAWKALGSSLAEMRQNARQIAEDARSAVRSASEFIQRRRAETTARRLAAAQEREEQARQRQEAGLAAAAARERQQAEAHARREAEREREARRREELAAQRQLEAEEARRREQEVPAQRRREAEEQRQRHEEARRQELAREQERAERVAAVRAELEQSRQEPQIAAAEVAPAQRPAATWEPPPVYRVHPRERDGNRALVLAAALALLVTLAAAAYLNRRPANPLSFGDLIRGQSVWQETPFGAATAPPPKTQPPPAAATPRPQAAPPKAATTPPAQPRPRARRLVVEDEVDMVAEDEVIIHRRRAEPTRSARSSGGVKRYSDLD